VRVSQTGRRAYLEMGLAEEGCLWEEKEKERGDDMMRLSQVAYKPKLSLKRSKASRRSITADTDALT